MKIAPVFIVILLFLTTTTKANDTLQSNISDSLTLAQAYINLSLTRQYFDTLKITRLSKILRYEESEMKTIKDSAFISANKHLYYTSQSLLHYNTAAYLFKTKTSTNRSVLVKWKKTLDASIDHFNKADLEPYFEMLENMPEQQSESIVYNDLIGFSKELSRSLMGDIHKSKSIFNNYFNADIYPDFKRIFYAYIKSKKNPLDSLRYYASLYNIELDERIVEGRTESRRRRLRMSDDLRIYKEYVIDIPNQLISRFLQLNYIATGKYNTPFRIEQQSSLYESYDNFKMDVEEYYRTNSPDSFFKKNINTQTLKILLDNIKKRYPNNNRRLDQASMTVLAPPSLSNKTKYYFPDPAPFPSAAAFVANYQPNLKSMKQVNDHLSAIFNNAGYKDRLHYYYVKTGFAVTTSLEKINKDGSPVSGAKRWDVSLGGNGSFSFYEVFKSIFFETESHFRTFALIISPKKIGLQSSPASIGGVGDLLIHSYPSLPQDLETLTIDNKTLSVLVYHFLQSDIGEVPILETKNALPVSKHLQNSGLSTILINQ